MPIDTEDSGFLSRWSRRKVLMRQGAPVADVAGPAVTVESRPLPLPLPPAVTAPQPTSATGTAQTAVGPPALPAATPEASPEGPPPPTLADVDALTRESDYSRFVGRGVQPEVKNAALTKLFTDPHFNVMDRLDVYIDDYGKPDPLPPGMLRQMLQAHVLGLFDEEDEQKKTALAHATQPPSATAPPTEPCADENTDLQLQPDDDAGCASPEPSVGQDAGSEHGRAGDGPHPAVPS